MGVLALPRGPASQAAPAPESEAPPPSSACRQASALRPTGRVWCPGTVGSPSPSCWVFGSRACARSSVAARSRRGGPGRGRPPEPVTVPRPWQPPRRTPALPVTARSLEMTAVPAPALQRAQVTRSCCQPRLPIHGLFLGTFHVGTQSHFPALRDENAGFCFPSIRGRVVMRGRFRAVAGAGGGLSLPGRLQEKDPSPRRRAGRKVQGRRNAGRFRAVRTSPGRSCGPCELAAAARPVFPKVWRLALFPAEALVLPHAAPACTASPRAALCALGPVPEGRGP